MPAGAGVQRTDADVAFPIDEVAALGENAKKDFKQGPCGKCFEVRCRTGNVLWDYGNKATTEQLGGTLLGDVTPDWKDSQGRMFPGYPDARSPPYQGRAKMTYAQCWCAPLRLTRPHSPCAYRFASGTRARRPSSCASSTSAPATARRSRAVATRRAARRRRTATCRTGRSRSSRIRCTAT